MNSSLPSLSAELHRLSKAISAPSEAMASYPLGESATFFMDWRTPVLTGLIYFFTVKFINSRFESQPSRKATRGAAHTTKKPEPFWFTALIFLHNVALCVFSALTFMYAAPLWFRHMYKGALEEGGLLGAYCDREGIAWNSGLEYWAWLFYLSKYYEIIDTIIILLKGRPSSLLQSYHHAGAMISMHLCVSSAATATWIFVVFNSFIHTIMYFYYALTTIGVRPPGKQYLTTLQITQFLVGGSLAASYLFIPGCKKGIPGETLAYSVTLGYLIPLTFLFVAFARRTYFSKKPAQTSKDLKNKIEKEE